VEPNTAPEERIKSPLASDNRQDRQRALVLVKERYRPKLTVEFRERFPEFSDEEFAAFWEQVIQQVGRLVDKGPFNPKGSLHKALLLMLLEEPLKLLLATDQASEWKRGLSLVAVLYEQPVLAVIRSRWPGLSEEDRGNAWQDTLTGLLQKVQAGAFQREGPLLGFLLGIVRHKVADYFRGKAALDRGLATLAPGRSASTHIDPGKKLEAEEFRRLLRQGIHSLPPREQQVVREFVEGFPDTADMQLLLKRVEAVSGEEESLSAVKVNLSRGKKRLGTFLRNHGYGGEGGDA
jgi:hypothetical protein